MKLNVYRRLEGAFLTLYIEGRLDTNSAGQLEEEIFSSLDGISKLTLDLEKLDYISSSGLRVLLRAQKEMERRGSMELAHVGSAIMDILDVTGFSDILTIK